MSSSIPQKQCTKCKQLFPATTEYFWRDAHLKDGLMSSCIECNVKRERLPEGMKRCPNCKTVFPLTSEHFGANKSETNGFNCYCRRCWREKQTSKRQQIRKEKGIVVLPDGLRKCGDCQNIYPATREYFSTHKMGKNGLNSTCKACAAQSQREYREQYPDRVKDTDRKRNKTIRRRESHRISAIRSYHSDPLKKEKARIKNNKRRALLNNAEGTHTLEDEQKQYGAQKGKCWWCGKNLNGKYHIDHVIPLSRGGTDWPNNIVCTCAFCNLSKNDRLPQEWIGMLF